MGVAKSLKVFSFVGFFKAILTKSLKPEILKYSSGSASIYVKLFAIGY